MSKELEIPLHAKSDPWILPFLVIIFLSAPVTAIFEGKFTTAVMLSFICLGIPIWLFRRVPSLLGARAVVSSDGLAVMRGRSELWRIRWKNVRSVTCPVPFSGVEELVFEVAGEDGLRTLAHLLNHAMRAELKQVIQANLPPGIHIETIALGFRPSRIRYLVIGLISLFSGCGALTLSWIWMTGAEATSDFQRLWIASSSWIVLAGVSLLGVAVAQLFAFAAWRPNRVGPTKIKHTGREFSLMVALQMVEGGHVFSSPQTFAYSERIQSMDLKRMRLISRLMAGAFTIFVGIMLVVLHVEHIKRPSEPPPLDALILIDVLFLLMIAGISWEIIRWEKKLKAALPFAKVKAILDGGRLYLDEGDGPVAVDIEQRPRLVTFGRDSSGLNSAYMRVRSKDKVFELDPLSMRNEEFEAA